MPRYFFHVIDGKEMLDTVGTVLAGEAEARAEAIVVSGEMLKDLGGAFWNHGEWQVRVETKPAAARLAGELWVGDRPQPRLAGAMLILADAADHTALENGDAIGPRRAVREGSPPGDAGGLHCRGLYGSATARAAVSRAVGSVLFRRRPAAKITSVSSTWCASRATSWARIRAVFRATPDERTATSHSAFCRSTRPTGLKPHTTKSRTVAIRYDRHSRSALSITASSAIRTSTSSRVVMRAGRMSRLRRRRSPKRIRLL